MAAARSLSLAAYRALVKRGQSPRNTAYAPRPEGELVWIHLGSSDEARGVLSLVDRLISQRPSASVLLTTNPGTDVIWRDLPDPAQCLVSSVPDEHPKSVARFLDHWRPDIGLWVWGRLRPNLIDETWQRHIPMHLIAAAAEGFDGRRDRWVPEVSRSLLQQFVTVSAVSKDAVTRLVTLGLVAGDVEVLAPLRDSGRLLPHAESDLEELKTTLGSRPIWFAANLSRGEWAAALAAHRQAMRNAHRLLLVIHPDDVSDIPALMDALRDAHLSFKYWDDGEWPESATQVLIADSPDDFGLWYRLATVSFLGNSMSLEFEGTDPLPAAALGTVILYGPHVRAHLGSYARLVDAGAARIVNSGEDLGRSVIQLSQPDRAAAMAHAGWSVISESAETIDAVIDLVQDTLDQVTPGSVP